MIIKKWKISCSVQRKCEIKKTNKPKANKVRSDWQCTRFLGCFTVYPIESKNTGMRQYSYVHKCLYESPTHRGLFRVTLCYFCSYNHQIPRKNPEDTTFVSSMVATVLQTCIITWRRTEAPGNGRHAEPTQLLRYCSCFSRTCLLPNFCRQVQE